MTLAKKVQKVYEDRYREKIEIIINKADRAKHSDLRVVNSKIKKCINFEFKDNLEDEIVSIFNLLEKSK